MLRDEVRGLKKDAKTWESEYKALLKEYDASEGSNADLKETVARLKARAEANVEGRHKTQIRREIYGYKAKFDKMLTAPAKGNTLHAPVAMTRALAEFCEIFSDSEQRRLSGASMELEQRRAKAVTSQELSTVERKELANARAKAKIDNLERQYAKLQNDPALNIFYREDVKTLISGLRESLAEKNLYEMSRAELNDVLNVMKGMHNAIVNANKVFTAGKNKTLLGMVRKMSAEMDQVNVNANGIAVAGRRYMMWQMSPDTFFDYICGYIKNNEGLVVQKMFSGGTERMLTVQRAFNERFDHITNTKNAEEAKQLRDMTRNPTKNMVDWGLKNAQGDRVLTSRGMMIQAYMLLKQEDSFNSIIWGGLKLPNAKEYYKGNVSAAYGDAPLGQILSESMTERYNSLYSEAEALREALKGDGLSAAEAEKAKGELQALEEKMAEMTAGAKARWIGLRDGIEKMLTPFEKDIIQTTKEWFTYSGELLCEVHEQWHGYRPNMVKDYVPIHRDPASIALDIRAEDPGKAFNLENSGFLKERVPSRAPILLTDFFNELNRQSAQISRYYGFGQVQADFNRLWNARIPGTTTTLKAKVGAKFGEGRTKSIFGVSGEKYVMNYIADIAGAKHEEGLFDRLYSAGASANLSGNLRVAVSQLASIPTASAEIGWKSVAKGFARGVQTGFSTKQKIALGQKNVWFYQRYRGAGGITEIADLKARGGVWEKVASSRVGKLLFNWCQSFDAFATATMWSMAEDYVKAHGTKAEDAGYQEAVNQAYTDIIRKTQPNYTVTERSDFLRDKRAGMKMFNMYKTQSNQNLNILLDANGRYIRAKRDLKNGKNGITQADVKAAGARLANAYTSVIIGGTMSFVLLRTAVNFLMGMVNPYRDDDDDEVTVGQTAKAMGSEMLSSLFGMFGLGGTLYDIVSAVVNREKFWGLTDSAISSASDLLTNSVNTLQMFTDPEKEFKWSQIEKDIGSFLSVIGAPYNNVKKFVTAAQMWYNDLKNGTFGQYTRAQTTTNQYRARLLEAYLDGDEEKRDDVLAYLMIEADAANDFEAEKDVQSGFCTFLKGKFTAGEVTEEDARGVMAYLGMEPDEIQEKLDQWRGIVDTDRTYTQEKDAYLEEEVSTDEFIAYLTQYMGRSEEEAAEEELRLRCQRDEGIVYGSIEEMMASGYLDEERGRELLAKYGGDSSAKDYFHAIMAGDTRSATAIRQNMKQELLADGYLTYEADSSIQSGFTTQVKNEYLDGKLDKSRAAALIRQYGGKEDPQTEIKKWDFQMDYGYSWGARARAYRTGSISKEALIRAVMDIEGETREDAEEYIRFLDLQKKNQDVEITASDASGYFEHAEPAGIKLETYLQFKNTVSGLESDMDENGNAISGSKKEKVLAAIDALPLTIAQKDALYYAQGYKESTLDEAPWHKKG